MDHTSNIIGVDFQRHKGYQSNKLPMKASGKQGVTCRKGVIKYCKQALSKFVRADWEFWKPLPCYWCLSVTHTSALDMTHAIIQNPVLYRHMLKTCRRQVQPESRHHVFLFVLKLLDYKLYIHNIYYFINLLYNIYNFI